VRWICNIHREIKNGWKRVLVDLNMQVACNVRAGGGLRSVCIALYGFKSALSYQLNNEELRYL